MFQFLELYPEDLDTQMRIDIALRRLLCNFLACSLEILIAREEDNIEEQVFNLFT
jgi:hypothetical protein